MEKPTLEDLLFREFFRHPNHISPYHDGFYQIFNLWWRMNQIYRVYYENENKLVMEYTFKTQLWKN